MKKGDIAYALPTREGRRMYGPNLRECEVVGLGPKYITVKMGVSTYKFDKETMREKNECSSLFILFESEKASLEYREAEEREVFLRQNFQGVVSLMTLEEKRACCEIFEGVLDRKSGRC